MNIDVINCLKVYDHVVEKIAIESSRESFEHELQGDLDTVILSDNTVVIFNEEAMSLDLPQNFLGMYGTIIFCKHKQRQIVSLDSYQQDELLSRLISQL